MGTFGWQLLADNTTLVGTVDHQSWNDDGDWSLFVKPAPDYEHLLGHNSVKNVSGYLECEVLPPPGINIQGDIDRLFQDLKANAQAPVTVFGPWVSDCGHKFDNTTATVGDNESTFIQVVGDIFSGGAHELVRRIPVPDCAEGRTEIHPITSVLLELPTVGAGATAVKRIHFMVISESDATIFIRRPFLPPHAGENRTGAFSVAFPPDPGGLGGPVPKYNIVYENRHTPSPPNFSIVSGNLQGIVQTGPMGYYYAVIELTYQPGPPIVIPPAGDPWKDAGTAGNVRGLAFWDGKLYAATSDNQLLVRDAGDSSASWLFVGAANNVVALTALDGKLYAATSDNQLLVRDAVPSDVPWAPNPLTISGVVALAAFDGKLYAATAAIFTGGFLAPGDIWVRDPVSSAAAWEDFGPGLNNLVGLAASWFGSGWVLYAATSDNQLFLRSPAAPDGTWQPIGHADSVAAMAGAVYTPHSGAVFAATSDGLLRMFETSRVT